MTFLHNYVDHRDSRSKALLIDSTEEWKEPRRAQGRSCKCLTCVSVGILVIWYIIWLLLLPTENGRNFCFWLTKINSCCDIDCTNLLGTHSTKQRHRSAPEGGEECTMQEKYRFDCHPEDGASELSCTSRGCCWKQPSKETLRRVPLNMPYCYYPNNWSIYKKVNETPGVVTFFQNTASSGHKKDIELIKMSFEHIDDTITRFRIVDANEKRWEPHLPIIQNFGKKSSNPKFLIDTFPNSPGFTVKRASDHLPMFVMASGGFIFADQFLQLSFLLPEGTQIYGLGEHNVGINLNKNWKFLAFFNRDQPPIEFANLYGSHPFALLMLKKGLYIGLLFLNSNAMEVILQPTPAITFRSIGGIFDFFSFAGPTPEDVLKQFSKIVGKPFMPPYWSLGFHLCRYNYGSLERTKEVWNRTRAAGIPFDTQWNDLDYMENNNDFTYDSKNFKELPKFVEELHEAGMHYIPLIDCGISGSEKNGSYRPFDEGVRRKIFVREAKSDLPFKGKVWNTGSTVWPDFTNPKTLEYWYDMMNDMWKMFPYDGAWIDMNEPSNFFNGHVNGCEYNDLENPQYVPNILENYLATNTLCMSARFYLGPHYNIHNTYGTSEAYATNLALKKIRKLRPFVISRSTWIGHGFYAGHWSGDIYSSWHDMRMTVPKLLSFSLFQVPMMGSDICGFDGNTTEALCNRWSQLGAFYPFSRNHNADVTIDQDPVALGDLVVASAKKALTIRYRFLPYLYTLFFRAHMFGETVARPLFFEFFHDSNTWDIDSQFLWGSSLMILPVFDELATSVIAYVPQGTWYNYYDKKRMISTGKNYTLDAPLDTIPLLVRGGFVLPGQAPGRTTTESRKNPFELFIALDEKGKARGELYWDDGDSLDSIDNSEYRWWQFNVENKNLTMSDVKEGKYRAQMILGKVEIMGVLEKVSQVLVNGIDTKFHYDETLSYLIVENLGVDLMEKFTLTWK